MKLIKPATVTDAQFVSSSRAEDDYPVWDPALAYSVGQRVIRTQTHRIYERLVAGTTSTAPENDTANWVDIGPTSRWAMFDDEIGSVTTGASPLAVTIKPGVVGGLALLELDGTGVRVQMREGANGTIVYDREINLDSTLIADWFEHFFEPYEMRSDVTLTDLPLIGEGHITVTVSGTGTVGCGALVVGAVHDLGDTQSNVSLGIIDYSKKETDQWGHTSVVERRHARRLSAQLVLDGQRLTRLYRLLGSVRATPCIWIASDDKRHTSLTVYGFYRDFNVDVPYPSLNYCSLEIEGLI